MTAGVFGMTVILTVLSVLRGRAIEWNTKPVLAKGLFGVSYVIKKLVAGALKEGFIYHIVVDECRAHCILISQDNIFIRRSL